MANASIKIDRDLLNLGKNARKGLITGLVRAGDVTQNEIQKVAPTTYTERTRLLRILTLRQPVNARDLSVQVIATVGQVGNPKNPAYGIFVNDGTRRIRARRFMEKGLNKASRVFENIFVKALDKTM